MEVPIPQLAYVFGDIKLIVYEGSRLVRFDDGWCLYLLLYGAGGGA